MCMKQTCPLCQKSTWYGCGSHIPQVMDNIPQSQRCTCKPKVVIDDKEYPPKMGQASATLNRIDVAYEDNQDGRGGLGQYSTS